MSLFKTTRQIGNSGEDFACNFLRKLGYRIVARNYTIRGGEIDIIARDKENLVFIEVKLRFGNKFGVAREAVTSWKLHYLQKAALFYIQKVNWANRPYRFDLVAIDYDELKNPKIEHLKNITG
jgi:putative endonuclease